MTLLEAAPTIQKIPEWAPAISVGRSVGDLGIFEDLDLDYAEISALLKSGKAARKNLKELHIHLAADGAWSITHILPNAGEFISQRLLKSSFGPRYIDRIKASIPGISPEDLDRKSFVIVNVDEILTNDPLAKTDPVGAIRSALVHELEHFIEHVKDPEKIGEVYDVYSSLGITTKRAVAYSVEESKVNFALAALLRREEIKVRQREKEIAESGAFAGILTASLKAD